MNCSLCFRIYGFFILCIVPILTFGQVQFYAKTDAREVLVNSYFEVQFVLENATGNNFVPPDFSPFKVVSGPFTSTNFSYVNGRRSQSKSYGYQLLASDEGSFSIGSASIEVGKNALTTNPLEIHVANRSNLDIDHKTEDVFIQVEISDTVVYPGEQILLKYVLYSRKRIGNYNYISNTGFDGFYPQEIVTDEKPVRRVLNGVEYVSTVLRTIALFPIQPGELYIEPMQLNVELVDRYNPFFPSRSNRKDIPVSSEGQWIEVKTLPGDPPETFNGALGTYSMRADIAPRQLTTDDAASLKLTVEGNGFSKFIVAPELKLKSGFDIYDPRVINETFYINNNKVVSKKTFEYLLVPKTTGTQSIQATFSYFNTDSATYETINSSIYKLFVSAGKSNHAGLSPQEILEKYQLRPLMLNTKLTKTPFYFGASNYFYALLILLFLAIPAMLIWKRYQLRKGRIDPALLRKKTAAKEASRRLKTAKNLLEQGNDQMAFYKAVSDALEKYIADKFTIQTSELNKEKIRSLLIARQVDAGDIETYFEILNHCEMALFGGISPEINHRVYERADLLLQKMLIDFEKDKK